MRIYTRESDDMNEVLSDFVGYNVLAELTNGFKLWGLLKPNLDEFSDGYQIGHYEFEKKEVVSLTDLSEDNR